MRYATLNFLFLMACLGLLVVLTKQRPSKATLYSLIPVLGLTAVFDSLIVASGIVAYNAANILGFYIGRAPIEDFAYAIASVLIVGLLWEYYESKK